jgi:hypothetical protein
MAGSKKNPEIIANVRTIDGEGEETYFGDCVMGVEVANNESAYPGGLVMFDLRGALKKANIVVRIDAEDLMQALTRAMVNREGK